MEPTLQAQEKQKVLVADDDAPSRILLRAAIQQWGYEIIEAKDGEEAWECLQQPYAPHLLIIDWIMPKLDGIDLCKRIKQELNFRPYVILLTQMTGSANIIKGLEAGADEFLSKPFNMAELRSRLSVGARIIHYEQTRAEQHKQLMHSLSQMTMLTNQVLEVTKKLDATIRENATEHNNLYSNTIQELNSNLKSIAERMAHFQSELANQKKMSEPS